MSQIVEIDHLLRVKNRLDTDMEKMGILVEKLKEFFFLALVNVNHILLE